MTGSATLSDDPEAITFDGLALLARLARRGATAVLADDAQGAPTVMLSELRGQSRARAGTMGWTAFADVRTRGLLEETDDGWRLSRKGRALVRRARATVTLERAEQAPGPTRVSNIMGPTRNEAESPLAWLRGRHDKTGRPLVDDIQFGAGERLRADLFFAQMLPRVTSSWSGVPQSRGARVTPGIGMDMTDRLVAARQRVARAIEQVGPELGGILIDVCGHLQGLEAIERREKWPQRSAKLVLQKALDMLARHYGLLPTQTAATVIAARMQHWGSEDYRPLLRPPHADR